MIDTTENAETKMIEFFISKDSSLIAPLLDMFVFSSLTTRLCLITKYSVEFRAALRGNFGDCGPKCESRGLRARYRLGLSRKPVTATCATSFLRHRQRQYQRYTLRHGARDDDLQFGRANEMMVSFAR
jgi:hypothetical protein